MNGFALAYREQQQLFLFDKTYLGTTLFKVGGLCHIVVSVHSPVLPKPGGRVDSHPVPSCFACLAALVLRT